MGKIEYSDRPIAIDFFAGAGGLSLGLEQAGFDVVLAVDRDGYHVATHKRNFPHGAVLCASVTELTGSGIRELLDTDREIDLIAGGPPCQGFSNMGVRDASDPRNTLVDEYVRLIAELKPRAFIMENVPGMQTGGTADIFDRAVGRLRSLGYNLTEPVRTLNAIDFGVPQKRERLFVLGVRIDVGGQADYPTAASLLQPTRPTVAEALAGLPTFAESPELLTTDKGPYPAAKRALHSYVQVARGLKQDPTDFSYPRVWESKVCSGTKFVKHRPDITALYQATAPGTMVPGHKLPRLDPNGAAPTLRAGSESEHGSFTAPRPVHPFEPRCITAREAARLHGYPDWFQFYPGMWHAYRQIGNSVCPQVARALGAAMMEALGHQPTRPDSPIELLSEFPLPDLRPKQHRRIAQVEEWPKILGHLLESALGRKGRLVRPEFTVEDVELAYQATQANMPRNPAKRFLQDLARSRNVTRLLRPVYEKGLSIQISSGDASYYGRFVKKGTAQTIESKDSLAITSADMSSAIAVKRNGHKESREFTGIAEFLSRNDVQKHLFRSGKLVLSGQENLLGELNDQGLRFRLVSNKRCIGKGLVVFAPKAIPSLSQLALTLERNNESRALVFAPITKKHVAIIVAQRAGDRTVERTRQVFELS